MHVDRLRAESRLVARIASKRGWVAGVRMGLSLASVYLRQVWLLTVARPAQRFTFEGASIPYLRHWHVTTFLNERTVEVPIVAAALATHPPGRLLEVGNVLNYYRAAGPHMVVDKYEVAPGVINADVVDVRGAFDTIVSISTLEHVGLDEPLLDPDKPRRAIAHLRSLLAQDGRFICTFPMGYNHALDAHLLSGSLAFDEVRYLRRLNAKNEWGPATAHDAAAACYGAPYPHANVLAIGMSGMRLDFF